MRRGVYGILVVLVLGTGSCGNGQNASEPAGSPWGKCAIEGGRCKAGAVCSETSETTPRTSLCEASCSADYSSAEGAMSKLAVDCVPRKGYTGPMATCRALGGKRTCTMRCENGEQCPDGMVCRVGECRWPEGAPERARRGLPPKWTEPESDEERIMWAIRRVNRANRFLEASICPCDQTAESFDEADKEAYDGWCSEEERNHPYVPKTDCYLEAARCSADQWVDFMRCVESAMVTLNDCAEPTCQFKRCDATYQSDLDECLEQYRVVGKPVQDCSTYDEFRGCGE